ncbi:hypothetical protein HKCCE4037_07670 [Rhodobacterales bacterium HKCCE4037]|nr:hypothetical protein [Rhodobacterales bacterium HKCCE4037]
MFKHHNTSTSFIADESGAVTVDWVVLTAGLVGLGLATIAIASGGVENLSNDTGQTLANMEIRTSFGSVTALEWTAYVPEDQLWLPWPEYFETEGYSDERLLEEIESYAHAADAEPGEDDYAHDHYWAAREEAERRQLDVPSA